MIIASLSKSTKLNQQKRKRGKLKMHKIITRKQTFLGKVESSNNHAQR